MNDELERIWKEANEACIPQKFCPYLVSSTQLSHSPSASHMVYSAAEWG
jgi:hypothetical protein